MDPSDMNVEQNRRDSFNRRRNPSPNFKVLAQDGFYATSSTQAECFFCGLEISVHEALMLQDMLPNYLVLSPRCPAMDWSNVPISANHAGSSGSANQFRSDDQYPRFPIYVSITDRMRSYLRWPPGRRLNSHQLSVAGFFYTAIEDRVQCYWCGSSFRSWLVDDDPWEQHDIWYKTCEYLVQYKGQRFVDQLREKKASGDEPSSFT